ncbi:hypothetical protein KCU77_g24245, partial [Aureobasidium melanogenum]
GLVEGAVAETMPKGIGGGDAEADKIDGEEDQRFAPLQQTLEDDLAEAGDEYMAAEKERARAMIDALPLDKYAIANGEADWDEAERQIQKAGGRSGKSTTVSVKLKSASSKRKAGEALEEVQKEAANFEGKKSKKGKKSR